MRKIKLLVKLADKAKTKDPMVLDTARPATLGPNEDFPTPWNYSVSREGIANIYAKNGNQVVTWINRDVAKAIVDEANSGLSEGLADMAHLAEKDHEVQMARADLYKIAKYAIKLHDMLKGVSEEQGLEGWQQSKITKASDYISAVYHNLDYDMKFNGAGELGEGKSPHKKGTKKYKKHMAAMHAETEYKSSLTNKLREKMSVEAPQEEPAPADAQTLQKTGMGARMVGQKLGAKGSAGQMSKALDKVAQGGALPANLAKQIAPIAKNLEAILADQQLRNRFMALVKMAGKAK